MSFEKKKTTFYDLFNERLIIVNSGEKRLDVIFY